MTKDGSSACSDTVSPSVGQEWPSESGALRLFERRRCATRGARALSELLKRHPNIGRRPAGALHRELIIGQGSRGDVARYRYDPLDDAIEILALRAQREAGFRDA